MVLIASAIFWGAFLLFQVQPMMGKFILPWFGGSPSVWTTCMLFFQMLLLGGYAYAHCSARWLKPRAQAAVHATLLLAALALLPITPSAAWKPVAEQNPTGTILLLLLTCLGLPYFVLSATGPLMQEWFRRQNPGASPYRLYALSNLGSLLALVSYPVAFEPFFTRATQARIWSWGLGLFAVVCGGCAWRYWRTNPTAPSHTETLPDAPGADTRPSVATTLLWLLLPACASVLLLAFTNKMCQDVAVIPFLWILPLGVYLVTFIICFDSPGLYSRKVFVTAFGLLSIVLLDVLQDAIRFPITVQLGVLIAALFAGCMICHGELSQLRPHPRHLTGYYLVIAIGGATGGILVGLLAPMLFDSYAELPWGLWGCALLVAALYEREQRAWTVFGWSLPVWWVALAGAIVLGVALNIQAASAARNTILSQRNFYAVLRVVESDKTHGLNHHYLLQSGQILHGLQFTAPSKAGLPTTYYHAASGVGLALRALHRPEGRRIGVVGLGVGTLAAYAQRGDTVRFYEINPQVEQFARSHFSYLARATGAVEVVMGDARLSLEREPSQQYDLLVLDAFSSDAIPVHLLTRDAFEIYLRHVKPNGVLAVHTSNRHLRLKPVVEKLAGQFQLHTAPITFGMEDRSSGTAPSEWVLVARDPRFLEHELIRPAKGQPTKDLTRVPLWTDEQTSLLPCLR